MADRRTRSIREHVDRGVLPFDACQVHPSVTARGRWTGKSMWEWNPGDRLTIRANGQEYRMAIVALTSSGEWEAIAEDRFVEDHQVPEGDDR